MNDTLPNNPDLERDVLGGMLLDPAYAVSVAQEILEPDDFFSPGHRSLFEGFSEIFAKHGEIPAGSVIPLADPKVLDRIRFDASTHVVDRHCAELRELGEKRRIIGAALRTARLGQEGAHIDELRSSVSKITQQIERNGHEEHSVPELVEAVMAGKNDEKVFDLGIYGLDTVLDGGISKSWLFVIGARRGVGKTAFGAHLAVRALRREVPVVWIACEMSRQQMIARLIHAASHVSPAEGVTDEALRGRFEDAGREIAAAPLIVEDRPMTIVQLYARCRRWHMQKRLGVLFIDYLQIMKHEKARTEAEAISLISRGAKHIAKEFHIPVIGMAQVRREGEYSRNKPILANLKGSGSLEEESDVVLLMWPGDGFKLETAIAKNRHGSTGDLTLSANFRKMQFGGFVPGGER